MDNFVQNCYRKRVEEVETCFIREFEFFGFALKEIYTVFVFEIFGVGERGIDHALVVVDADCFAAGFIAEIEGGAAFSATVVDYGIRSCNEVAFRKFGKDPVGCGRIAVVAAVHVGVVRPSCVYVKS